MENLTKKNLDELICEVECSLRFIESEKGFVGKRLI
jgi:hypothetical protein